MWPGFRELQCVLAAPSVEKRLAPVLHDDSGRLVDMSMVRENLYIGDEYEKERIRTPSVFTNNIKLIDFDLFYLKPSKEVQFLGPRLATHFT